MSSTYRFIDVNEDDVTSLGMANQSFVNSTFIFAKNLCHAD